MATKKQASKLLTPDQAHRLFHIAAMAVFQLGGASRALDTEDVAIRCHGLAPGLFAWRKFPDQVNLELVRVSLSDAKKLKNGALVSGSGRSGWRLTRKGLEWATKLSASSLDPPSSDPLRRRGGSVDTVRLTREIARIEQSPAWAAWIKGQQIIGADARALFRVDSYATQQLIDTKVTRLLSQFKPGVDHYRFLEAAASALKLDRPSDGNSGD